MLDRKIAPAIREIDAINFEAPHQRELNGIPFIHMNEVPNDTCRFDLYFNAGKIRERKTIPSIVNGLLLSGTPNKDTNEIHEAINSLGAYFESGVSVENAVISIYCLKENLLAAISEIVRAILEVDFPQAELNEYLADRKQQLQISLKKVGFKAQRTFQGQLFISDERYSEVSELADFSDVSRSEIVDFHLKNYVNGLEKIVLVGAINESEIEAIALILDKFNRSSPTESASLKNNPATLHQEIPDALQSAIRIGKILFTKTHPDYLDFLILNTILGDYFGSRLMMNIREDKGYTYGIGSHLVEFEKTGYFVIGTEVKKEVREAAIQEIKKEIERLQNEIVEIEELELVKNYMLGQLLKSADGPYAMTDLFLSAHLHGKDLEFYNEAISSIQGITPERIQELAIKHLKWEEMTVVSAG